MGGIGSGGESGHGEINCSQTRAGFAERTPIGTAETVHYYSLLGCSRGVYIINPIQDDNNTLKYVYYFTVNVKRDIFGK